jgi:hypothetical protein
MASHHIICSHQARMLPRPAPIIRVRAAKATNSSHLDRTPETTKTELVQWLATWAAYGLWSYMAPGDNMPVACSTLSNVLKYGEALQKQHGLIETTQTSMEG